ncbi:hypothetical protein ACL1FV_13080, partial [Corynebacterium striatum]
QRCRAIRHDASPPAFGDTCFDVVVRLLRYADVLAELLDRDALSDRVEIRYLLAESEVPRILFLGLCLDFHYFLTGVVFPKSGFDFSRRAVAQALVEP